MKTEKKNILILAASSDMAQYLIKKLLSNGHNVYAASRSALEIEDVNLHKYELNLNSENSIQKLFSNFSEIKFDSIVDFLGIAISSPVEKLEKSELHRQFEISLYSLLEVLKCAKACMKPKGTIVNVSSMAAFGIFPFLAPYSMAKAASDIMLQCFEVETGIKTVSIKPGVVKTKFWKSSVEANEENFKKFSGEYETIGAFLKDNALKNGNRGLHPDKVSKLIYKVINKKNPKASYTIGADAKLAHIAYFCKGRKLFDVIKHILKRRTENYLNEQ